MEQGPPRETDCCSAGQEICRILWNPNIHYLVNKIPVISPYAEPQKSSSNPHTLFI